MEKNNENGHSSNSKSTDQPIDDFNEEPLVSTVNVSELSKVMFSKVADYINGELTMNCEDYRLIEEMNRVTINKYSDMKQITSTINQSLNDLGEKYNLLEPYLKQIDEIDDAVLKLEQAAYKLDAYSKKLEQRFKNLEMK